MRKSILSHAATFACGMAVVCGLSLTTPHRVSSGVYGDVNGDGAVDIEDVNEVIGVMLGLPHVGERHILVASDSLPLDVSPGGVCALSLDVRGSNLRDSVAVTVVGGEGVFDVWPRSLTRVQAKNGATLTVRYSPVAAGADTATLLLTSDEAPDVEVKLVGTAAAQADSAVTSYVVDGVTFAMVAVEGGTFVMGATPDLVDEAFSNEQAHEVMVSSFAIGEMAVTQELWQTVMGVNPSWFNGYGNEEYGSSHADLNYYEPRLQRPVEFVSWSDCQEFVARLSALTGRAFRLPTEAEWEFAARGGVRSGGYRYAGSNDLDSVAWYYDNSFLMRPEHPDYGPQPVGMKAPNELGLYDMTGNVWEWCNDLYDRDYYSVSPHDNPTGPSAGSHRVQRGGSWNYGSRYCRVSDRGHNLASIRRNSLGLRLAL